MSDLINESEVDSLLHKLHQLKDELDEEIDSLQTAAQPVTLDQQAFGRVSRGEALQQQNIAKASLNQCQQRVKQVEMALHKIETEDYGYCDGCGEPISLARLTARPETPLCLQCQQQQEQQ